ncbi:unnamed protein product [Caenorhabditis sp. 36 PRJEB53466]|nr:unnamed protein product [Caenorhabditis sp. 36 PRJEB53466]
MAEETSVVAEPDEVDEEKEELKVEALRMSQKELKDAAEKSSRLGELLSDDSFCLEYIRKHAKEDILPPAAWIDAHAKNELVTDSGEQLKFAFRDYATGVKNGYGTGVVSSKRGTFQEPSDRVERRRQVRGPDGRLNSLARVWKTLNTEWTNAENASECFDQGRSFCVDLNDFVEPWIMSYVKPKIVVTCSVKSPMSRPDNVGFGFLEMAVKMGRVRHPRIRGFDKGLKWMVTIPEAVDGWKSARMRLDSYETIDKLEFRKRSSNM